MPHKSPLRFGSTLYGTSSLTRLGRTVAGYHWSREIAEQAKQITISEDAVTVNGEGVSTDAAFFGGALPTAATDIIIPHGSKLTITDGDSFACNRMSVFGELEIIGGTSGDTAINLDTIIVWPGGWLSLFEPTGNPVVFNFDTSTDIDIATDPWQLSRSVICLGAVTIFGKPRQHILPLSNDVLNSDTTQLDFTITPFIGKDGPAGDGKFNYSAWTLDIEPGEKLILPAMRRRLPLWTGNHQSEIVEVATFNLVENSTPFSEKDTNGSSCTLTGQTVYDHKAYHDPLVIADLNPGTGPDAGAQTEGSHVNFLCRPFAVRPERTVKLVMSDPAAPVHRRPSIIVASSAATIAWTELQRLGRTTAIENSVVPEEGAIAYDTNLRYRHAFMVYDAGYAPFEQVEQGLNCARLIGNSVWSGGAVGIAANDIAGGTLGSAISVYRSAVYLEANVADNIVGSCINIYDNSSYGACLHNVASCNWGDKTNTNVEPSGFKNLEHYNAGDTGRDGSGYYSVSRSFHWIRNFAFGFTSTGRTILSRFPGKWPGFRAEYMPDGIEQIGYRQHAHALMDDDNPRVFIQGDYFVAGGSGRIISKNDSWQQHGHKTHIFDCVYIECSGELALDEYTGNYVVVRNVMLGPETPVANQRGHVIGQQSVGFTCVGNYIANVAIGTYPKKGGALDPEGTYSDEFANMKFVDYQFRNVPTPWDTTVTTGGATPDVVNLGGDYSGDFGFNIDNVNDAGAEIIYTGTVVDPLGTYPLIFASPAADNQGLKVSIDSLPGACAIHGYYTNTGAGAPYFTLYAFRVTHRLDPNQEIKVLLPVPMSSVPDESHLFFWRHPSGAAYELEHKGSADFDAALAAVNVVANNGVVFP